MKCLAYCTSAAYNTTELFRSIERDIAASRGGGEASPLSLGFPGANSAVCVHLEGESVHVELAGRDGEEERRHIFYFSYGAVVFWGLREAERIAYLEHLTPFQKSPLKRREEDLFTLSLGEKMCVVKDEIILPSDDALSLLAVSHALAQSVKLEAFENSLDRIIELTEPIPENLAANGKIALSRRAIHKMIGRLLIERNSINIQCDVLDTPEFFWRNVELKPLYNTLARYLALEDRVEVLNQRLDIVHDLFEMLSNELNHQHSSRLEWTIIVLIVVEVILTLLKDVFKVL